ncbi:ubiquitin-like protein 7 [Ptychodera flava]|uniref:ubiquitin-like protein 7 n=1 Tax=Ptychodera flava TaxID=63121 RepID=UPI003969F74B
MEAPCMSVKFPEKSGRIQLEGVEFSNNVEHLKGIVADKISLGTSQFDLIFCGRCLRDENSLQSYGIKPGVTVHALRKKETEPVMEAEPMDEAGIQQLLTALHAALINPTQRNTVLKILTNREMLDNVIVATPCLQTDPQALAMLQDPELLIQLADPKMVHKIVKAHPALGQAALQLAAAVNEESANERGAAGSDDEMETDAAPSRPQRSQQSTGTQTITSAQLSAALATAGVSGNQPSTSSGRGAAPRRLITVDLFSQAMAQAMASTGQTAERSAQLQAQLQQLREMGITDDRRSIRALQATDGDVQAALELIFDGSV